MKSKIPLIGLLLLVAGLFTVNFNKATGEAAPKQPHAVIIIGFQGRYGPIVHTGNGGYRPQIGEEVTWVTKSPNANVEIQEGEDLATVIARILNSSEFRKDQYDFEPATGYGRLMFVR